MSNTYFFSDTHFHHKNIVRGVTQWERNEGNQETRDFDSLEAHDEHLITQINKYVKEDDELWHLGDWSFGGIEQIWNFRKRLICNNIHLILGNHDHHIEGDKKLPNCHTDVNGKVCDGAYDRYKDERDLLFAATAADLFKSVQHVKFGHIGHRTFFLSHYAHRVWNKSHHGVIHLYGHSHDTLDNTGVIWGKSMDVSVESSLRYYGEIRPFHLNDIVKIMDKRDTKIVDHHNKNTN